MKILPDTFALDQIFIKIVDGKFWPLLFRSDERVFVLIFSIIGNRQHIKYYGCSF